MTEPPSSAAVVQVATEEPPRIVQIYRDPIEPGAMAAFTEVERRAATICVELGCPHPHLAVEMLTGPSEVWWLNFYSSDEEKRAVAAAYSGNERLMEAFAGVTRGKEGLTAVPDELFVSYRADLGGVARWTVAGSRYFVAGAVSVRAMPQVWTMYEAPDGRLFGLTFVRSRTEAELVAAEMGAGARLGAIRPDLGFPAPQWLAADPELWRDHPVARRASR